MRVTAFWVYGNEVPLAGPGVPGVGEYAVAEFAAATGMSTDAGRTGHAGHALEVAWRLPKLWEHVQAGTVPVWRARMVAGQTRVLTAEAAGFVDKHVAAVAGGRPRPARTPRVGGPGPPHAVDPGGPVRGLHPTAGT